MKPLLKNVKTQIVPIVVVCIIDLAVWLGMLVMSQPLCKINSVVVGLPFVGGLVGAVISVTMFIRLLLKKRFREAVVIGLVMLLSLYVLLVAFLLMAFSGICSWQF